MQEAVRAHLIAQAHTLLQILEDIGRFGEDAYSVADPNETYGDLLRHILHAMQETLERGEREVG
ncbi:MAG: hypothetical protein K6U87_15445 [Firmicutes bacterium]|nr:hypothetical protein [Bacillota bacterium]